MGDGLAEAPQTEGRLKELALLFLRLGTTAFGGPAVHVAMMEDEVVRRRRWLSPEEFLDLLGAVNVIPGPNSTELAIHIGYLRAGVLGLLVAGACFILPAALVVGLLASIYVRFGRLPQFAAVLYGIEPVVIAVVLLALLRLGRTALKSLVLLLVAALAILAGFAGVHELAILFGAGALVGAAEWASRTKERGGVSPASLLLLGPPAAAATAAVPFGFLPLFLFFLKTGSVLFGSGYVLLAFLRSDLVERWHWLTETQLLDAIAVGQITPGPVFTTATFVGYVLGGTGGAAVATVGIILPAFLFVALSGPLLPFVRRSKSASAVLDGLNAGSLALMAAVLIPLSRAALVDLPATGLALVSLIVLARTKLNPAWLLLAGAGAGLALRAGS